MSFIRLSDTFATDWRIQQLDDAAYRVFFDGCSFAAANNMDATVPHRWLERRVRSKTKRERIAADLADVGLWTPVDAGYLIEPALRRDRVDLLIRLETYEETEARRREAAERKARQRERERGQSADLEPAVTDESRRDRAVSHWGGKERTGTEAGKATENDNGELSPWALTEAEKAQASSSVPHPSPPPPPPAEHRPRSGLRKLDADAELERLKAKGLVA